MFLFVEQLCLYYFVKALQTHLLNTLFTYVSYILVLIKLSVKIFKLHSHCVATNALTFVLISATPPCPKQYRIREKHSVDCFAKEVLSVGFMLISATPVYPKQRPTAEIEGLDCLVKEAISVALVLIPATSVHRKQCGTMERNSLKCLTN